MPRADDAARRVEREGAKRLLGWEASISLEDGLRDVVDWIRRTREGLVTGATGFVAAAAPALARRSRRHRARARRRPHPADGRIALEVDLDLRRSRARPTAEVDAVVHLAQANVPFPEGAASSSPSTRRAPQELLEHARVVGAARFVYASSGSVYGLGERSVDEDDPLAARRLLLRHEASRRAASSSAYRDLRHDDPAPRSRRTARARRERLIPRLVERDRRTADHAQRRRPPRMNPIYVDDVVRGRRSRSSVDGHHVVNVAGDEATDVRDAAELIGEVVGIEPVFEPTAGGRAATSSPTTRGMHELLGEARLVPLARGSRPRNSGRTYGDMMCGIAGILDRAGARSRADARADEPLDRAPRARRRGRLRRWGHRPRERPPRDHRRLVGRPPADARRGRQVRDRLQRRALQLPRAGARARGRAATGSIRGPTRRSCCAPTRSGGRLPRALQRHVRVRGLGRARARALSSLATGSGSSRSTTRKSAGRSLFGSEVKALARGRLPARVSPVGLVEYFTFQNVFSDATLFDGVRMLGAGHSADGDWPGTGSASHALLGPRLRAPDESVRQTSGSSGPRGVRERRVGAARERRADRELPLRRHGLGVDRRSSRLDRIPRLMTFTGGFDLKSVTGLELVFDERADAEAIASSFRTEHYEMVMHSGDMAWVLPELVWHLEDLRVGMSYQNHYIARLASKFVKVALAGTGGDELFAGYPWRYELVEDADDPAEFERRHYSLLDAARRPTTTSRSLLHAETSRTRDDGAARGLPRTCSRRPPISTATRGAVLRGQDVPPRPARRRGRVSMAHSLEVTRAVPRQRARRPRAADPYPAASTRAAAASASCARRCAGCCRRDRREAEAGLQPARPVVVPRAHRWTTSCAIVLLDPRARARLLPARRDRARARRARAGRATTGC